MNPRSVNVTGLALSLACLLLPNLALARSTDRNQPMELDADSQDCNVADGNSKCVFSGNVVIRQGKRGLEMQFGKTAELLGDIEHWQHDSFIVRWRDRSLNADAFVNFALDADGNIRELRIQPVSPLTDFSFDFQDLRLVPVAAEKQ